MPPPPTGSCGWLLLPCTGAHDTMPHHSAGVSARATAKYVKETKMRKALSVILVGGLLLASLLVGPAAHS